MNLVEIFCIVALGLGILGLVKREWVPAYGVGIVLLAVAMLIMKYRAAIVGLLTIFLLGSVVAQPAVTFKTNVVQLPVTNVTVTLRAVTNVAAVDSSGNTVGIFSDTNALSLLPPQAVTAVGFLTGGTNWMIAPFAIYDTGTKKVGGGIAGLYSINQNVGTGLRVDYLNGTIFMPSMNLQLEVPIPLLGGKTTAVPFTFGGIATVLSGKGSKDNTPVGMFGIGMAVRITKMFDLVFDVEKWTEPFTGKQYRAGVLIKL